MSFEEESGVPVQQEGTVEKEICRDFKKGDCRRGERCIYHHPKLDVCRDFQSRGCMRQGCRFAHLNRAEEEIYTKSGILPDSMNNGQTIRNNDAMNGYNGILGKRNYNAMSGASPMPPMSYGQENSSPSEMCRDFEKGDCRRGTRCKFYHPKLIICRDFQKEKCDRSSCRYLHMTREEEETYDGNGILPDHIDKKEAMQKRVMAPPAHNGGGIGRGEMYGTQRQDNNNQMGINNASFTLVLQENEALKSKLTEMQQQITDLRKMNDTLYEQNNMLRNGYK